MAVYADRVKETTSTTGTGTYSLDGASAGYRTFVAGVGSGNLVTYTVTNNVDWEVGEGTITSGSPDTLTRTTIIASSNSGAAVSWAAGSKDIFLTASAPRIVFNDKNNTLTGTTLVPDGSLSTPSIAFSGDTDLGIYRDSANGLAISAGTGSSTPPLLVTGQNSNNSGIEIAGNNGGFPDIISKGTATNINLGLYSKGTGYVSLGDAGSSYGLFYVQREGTPNGYFDLYVGNGTTRIGAYNNTLTTAQPLNLYTSGATTSSSINLGTYNGTTYRTTFSAVPAATLTTTPNYVTAYSNNSGAAPSVEAEGGDANINLDLFGKGTGSIRLNGTSTTVTSAGVLNAAGPTFTGTTNTGALTVGGAFISSSGTNTFGGSGNFTVSTSGTVSVTGNTLTSTRGFASAEFAGGNATGSVNINFASGQNQIFTLTGNTTFTFLNPTNGATYKIRLVQGGSGSYTVSWPVIKWAGGAAPTLSTIVGREDIITLYYNGTSYYGQATTDFR